MVYAVPTREFERRLNLLYRVMDEKKLDAAI